MKILILGNSQAGSLKKAYDAHKSIIGDVGEIYFYVLPGGTGPYLKVVDDRFVQTVPNSKNPPYADPPETPEMPISSFDAIVISALGYVDGGACYDSLMQRRAVLPEFGPIGAFQEEEFVSDHCYQQLFMNAWRTGHQGFILAASLKNNFDGPVFVQPFPHISSAIQEQEDWELRKLYKNYLGAHAFFTDTKESSLRSFEKEFGFTLLDYPAQTEDGAGFTDAKFMIGDFVHPTPEYGALVLDQIAKAVSEL